MDTKNSSSWEQDKVDRKSNSGSKEETQERPLGENLFSSNPFDFKDLGIRKPVKEDDIFFGKFESPTAWRGNIDNQETSKVDQAVSHRKSASNIDFSKPISLDPTNSTVLSHRKSASHIDFSKPVSLDPTSTADSSVGYEMSIATRDSRESPQMVERRPVDADIEYMMNESTLLDDIRIDPIEDKDKQEKKKRFSFRRIESNRSVKS